jgi:hypothetical protein
MSLWEKFLDIAIYRFGFLEEDFNFQRNSANPPFLIYVSDKISVRVFYDAENHCELDLRIRRNGDDPRKTPSIGLTTLMFLAKGKKAEHYLSPFPSTEEQLEIEVRRLAELLRQYGGDILRGDERVFERIEALRRMREEDINKQAQEATLLREEPPETP